MPAQAALAQAGNHDFIVFDKFERMNTRVARQNLPENQVSWQENLQPIAANDLKAVPGPSSSLSSLGAETVTRQFPANIGAVDYIISFTLSGKCFATNANTGANTTIVGTPGTFSTTPDMTVFASSRILIMDPTKGYATWDGTLFVGSGGISPNIVVTNGGSGYSAPPAITFTGGAGGNAGGATAHAVMGGSGGAQFVSSIVLDSPGTGNAAGAAITVVITGAHTILATATVVVWPQVTGNTIDVFAGRVWWASTNASGQFRVLNFTGTAGFDDINPANAAGSTTITDRDLAHGITALRNLNNFLYIFGDQSIKQIGSINVVSSITLFTILTLSSDIGTSFLMTILSYNRLVLFANKQGVYGIFGATVQKISDDLDGIFQATDFTQSPCAALNDLNNNHCYLLLLKYLDPVAGARSIIATYQQNKWFVCSQGALVAMCSVPLASTTQVETFGSSTGDITQILSSQTTSVPILLITSLTPHGNIVWAKQVMRTGIALTTTTPQNVTVSVDTENDSNDYQFAAASVVTWVNNSNQPVQFQNNALANVNFSTGGFKLIDQSSEGYGKFVGNTVSGTVQGLSINAIVNEYTLADAWGKGPGQ